MYAKRHSEETRLATRGMPREPFVEFVDQYFLNSYGIKKLALDRKTKSVTAPLLFSLFACLN